MVTTTEISLDTPTEQAGKVEYSCLNLLDFIHALSNMNIPLVRTNKRKEYYNIPAAFDIEVSSFYYNEKKCASMYIWQFGVGDIITYGRTWDQFTTFIHMISKILCLNTDRRLIVYVHNLSYEFQFIRK